MKLFPRRTAGPLSNEVAVACAPSQLTVHADHIRVGDTPAATMAVTGYPADVPAGFLASILALPVCADITVHIDPIPSAPAAAMLKRQRARMESSRALSDARGQLSDPATDAAAADATDLAERLARGQAKLFHAGIYLTAHAHTTDELHDACAQITSAAAAGLLDVKPVTWRHDRGWTSTLPLAADSIGMRRVFDTDALAASFPLAANDLPAPLPGDGTTDGGVLYGVAADGNGIVWWDRWSLDNHNSVTFAPTGAGKSYLMKLEVLRSRYQGIEVHIIDPEDEYRPLAQHLGGTTIAPGQPGVHLNPLDLPTGPQPADTLTLRALFLHTLVATLLTDTNTGSGTPTAGPALSTDEKAALDKAIVAVYAKAGITADPSTWDRPAPLFADLAAVLESSADKASRDLASRLSPWVSGSFSQLFAGHTTHTPSGGLVVWSLRYLPEEQRAAGTLLALDAIWRHIDNTDTKHRRRTLVVVDEAWKLMRTGEGAAFLAKMAKSARKRHAGLGLLSQDVEDVLSSSLGRVILANAATQILMSQSAQALPLIADTFGLTAGEARRLRTLARGQALLVCGDRRAEFAVVASPAEDRICRTGLELDQDLE